VQRLVTELAEELELVLGSVVCIRHAPEPNGATGSFAGCGTGCHLRSASAISRFSG
jgi:hypothetical protein